MRGISPRLVLPKHLHPMFAEQIDGVRADPGFYAAMRLHADATRMAPGFGCDPYYAKHMGDAGNLLIEQVAYLHHLLKEHQDHGAGATLGKLQRAAFIHGFASPRRVTMYVKRLVQVGRMSYSEDARDRRVRRLIPGPELCTTALRHTRNLTRAAAMLWPGEDLNEHVERDPEYLEALYIAMLGRYLAGADPLRPFADVRHFTSKDAGSYLLGSMIYGCLEHSDKLDPATEFTLSYADAAAACGVSRTHVRNVIEAAEGLGLVTKMGEGGRSVRLTQKMIGSYERYFACLMILVHAAAGDALESLNAG